MKDSHMAINGIERSARLAGALLLAATAAAAEPGPGDVFREYAWRGPWVNAVNWQRVTDPEAGHSGAQDFLPNPVNRVTIDDLEGAIAAEVYIEQWGGHAGTSAKRLRLNGHDWIAIPEPAGIPGNAGQHEDPECYQYLNHTAVPLPLDQLQAGVNSFEFTAGPQICFGFNWGQWGVYGVTFRIYYDPAAKAHVRGRLTGPQSGGERPVLGAEVDDPAAVQRVDFIARYEDFDYEGNGLYRQWHYTYRYGRIQHHVGSADTAPFAVTWDTEWVPDQPQPVEIIGRVLSDAGLYYMTPVAAYELQRPDHSVRLYKPYNVPGSWQTRARQRHSCQLYVAHDLRRASAARLLLSTWSGGHADAIGINDSSLVRRVGKVHDYSHDYIPVDPGLLRHGVNRAFTYAETDHHGIEVLWPGIALKVRYDAPVNEQPGQGDLRLYDDALAAGWQLLGPPPGTPQSATRIDPQATAAAFEGDTAIEVEASQLTWQLRLVPPAPLYLEGYEALRFSLLPRRIEDPARAHLELRLDDRLLDLGAADLGAADLDAADLDAAESGTGAIDWTLDQWQTVEIPLKRLDLRRPYLAELQLFGVFSGLFYLDDLRLVGPRADTAVAADAPTRPAAFDLGQNRPNPFNGQTAIDFTLSRAAPVRLELFNLSGQRLVQLADGAYGPGRHRVLWDGRDGRGRPAASGVYLYRLSGPDGHQTRRLLLLR